MNGTLTCAFMVWRPEIGDNHPMGWVTVAVYALASVAAMRTARQLTPADGADRRERWFWIGTSVLLALLAVNKQLDLQSLLTTLGRCHAELHGWYGIRQRVQLAFVLCSAALGHAVLGAVVVLLRGLIGRVWPALFGLGFVLLFVLVRMASFHHVDALIGTWVFGVRLNWALELPGPILVLAAALRRMPVGTTA